MFTLVIVRSRKLESQELAAIIKFSRKTSFLTMAGSRSFEE